MPKFRKKPVVIEARQFKSGSGLDELAGWCGGSLIVDRADPNHTDHMIIKTLEGDHRADSGDWIIQGVQGEFYPCKPDIFEATYEPV